MLTYFLFYTIIDKSRESGGSDGLLKHLQIRNRWQICNITSLWELNND